VVSPRNVAYRIDSADCITAVNDEWVSFALTNGDERLLPPQVLGTSLWSWIGDEKTCQVYRSLLTRVRKDAADVRFRFRCDAPDRRRLLQMQMTLVGSDEVDFRTTTVHDESRAAVDLMDAATVRSDAILTICGWCMRVPVTGTWLEIEEAVAALGLLEAEGVPSLSHGICPACYDAMIAEMDSSELGHSGQVTLGALP